MKHGKKYVEKAATVERGNLYDVDEAIALVKKNATAKFNETIEVHIRTGCDGRHADQQIRGAVVLPNGTGKEVRVLVFAKGEKEKEALEAGADFVGAEELIPKIAAYRGTLHSVEGLLKLLEDPELLEIRAILDKANLYETFLNSLDATDPWAKAAAARFHEVEDQMTIAYAFEDPEIMEMPLKKRQEIISDERLTPYAWSLRRFTDPEQEALGEEALRVETLMGSAMNNRDTRNTFDNVELPRPAFT